MHSLFPVFFAWFWIALLGVLQLLFLRLLHKDWWQRRWIRRSAIGLPIAGILAVVAWAAGEYYALRLLGMVGGVVVALVFVALAGLMFSLPISGIIHGIDRLIHSRRQRAAADSEVVADPRRRLFLKGTATALPLVTLSMGAAGVGRSLGPINIPLRKIAVAGLPTLFDGFRILQISDTHLWHYVTLDHLSTACEKAAPMKPDLVLVTGDIADDIRQLPAALNIIAQLRPPLGIFASLGNHEYFRGINEVRKIFDASPIPLLINQGVHLTSRNQFFYLAGIDDPRSLGHVSMDFFKRTIDQALRDRSEGEFTLLMSHRPDALDYASERSVNFTLAGHTHGGQIGLLGRSVFEPAFPQKYLWGTYRKGNSSLYTTAGAGHWFPFRLGCPPEAPIIELHHA